MGAHLVFVDESGFQLIGTVRRTWAPRGQTPVTRYRYQQGKVSVISGLSVSPRRFHVGLYFRLHECNIRQPQVCAFLRQVLRHLRHPVIVLWDNGKIHKGPAIREFHARHPRLHLEYFPGYAPELNPDEGVWDHAKQALANGRPNTVQELFRDVLSELKQLRHAAPTLRACIHTSGLPSFLP